MKKIFSKWNLNVSLYVRFITVLLFNSVIIFLAVGGVSYFNLKSLHETRTFNGILTSINNICSAFDATYTVLSDMSLLFATDKDVLDAIGGYYEFTIERDREDVKALINFDLARSTLEDKLNILTGYNHTVGYALMYNEDYNNRLVVDNLEEVVLQNMKTDIVVPLYQNGTLQANTIHESVYKEEKLVISTIRDIYDYKEHKLKLYMETDVSYIKNVFKDYRFSKDAFFAVKNMDQQVIFSENEGILPCGYIIKTDEEKGWSEWGKNYSVFEAKGAGYSLLEFVPHNDYDMDMRRWIWQLSLIVLGTIVLIIFLTLIIWRSICKPMQIFSNEFRLMAENKQNVQRRIIGIKEFDRLLNEFYNAKESVQSLNKEILEKERRQKELEIEKLLIQINPHFIHNTLNCIQWLARIKGDNEIQEMVMLFTRVLNYNLGKKSVFVTVEEELDAIKNYVELQKRKNGIRINSVFEVDVQLLSCVIPRFILQPLVENSILYGNAPVGNTVIEIFAEKESDDYFVLSVKDNGRGMDEEIIKQLKGNVEPKKLGIGLKYVKQMIQFYCGDKAYIDVDNDCKIGTKILLKIPICYKEEDYDQGINS